jgi:hypothetical protein
MPNMGVASEVHQGGDARGTRDSFAVTISDHCHNRDTPRTASTDKIPRTATTNASRVRWCLRFLPRKVLGDSIWDEPTMFFGVLPSFLVKYWRRRRDSNPRYAFGAYNGLAIRKQPCRAIPRNPAVPENALFSAIGSGASSDPVPLCTYPSGGNCGGKKNARASAPEQHHERDDDGPADQVREMARPEASASEDVAAKSCAEIEAHRRKLPRQVYRVWTMSRPYSATHAQSSVGGFDLVSLGVLVAGSEAE